MRSWIQVGICFILIGGLTFSTSSIAAGEAIEVCLKSGKGCSEIDLDSDHAKEAYEKGCLSKDFYACARLGQYYEVRSRDLNRALHAYDQACAGHDEFGCKGSYEVNMRLCYLEGRRAYCGRKEPRGEFRILAFLITSDPKYEDAFVNHDFDSPWVHKKTANLYEKRIKARDRHLLRALQRARKEGHHDGADAESLQSDIWKLQGDPRGDDLTDK